MPRTDATARPNRSASMILQPDDIVPLTAEEAAADIENAVRAFCRKPDNTERRPPRR